MSKRVKVNPAKSLLDRATAGEPHAVAKIFKMVIKHGGYNAVRRSG